MPAIRLMRTAVLLGLAALPLAGCYVAPAYRVRPAPVYVRPPPPVVVVPRPYGY